MQKHLTFRKSTIEGVEIKRCRKTPHSYKAHVHNELSLGYIVEGSTTVKFDDEIIHYDTGDGVIIPPLLTHRCEPEDIDYWEYIMLYIEPDYYKNSISFNRAQKLTGNQVKQLIRFINQLLSEEKSELLETILIELLLTFGEVKESISKPDKMTPSVREFIINHIDMKLSLQELESYFSLNKFTISLPFTV